MNIARAAASATLVATALMLGTAAAAVADPTVEQAAPGSTTSGSPNPSRSILPSPNAGKWQPETTEFSKPSGRS